MNDRWAGTVSTWRRDLSTKLNEDRKPATPLSGVRNLKSEQVKRPVVMSLLGKEEGQSCCSQARAERRPWKQVGRLLDAQAHNVFIPGATNRVQPYDSHFPGAPWRPHGEGHLVRRAGTTGVSKLHIYVCSYIYTWIYTYTYAHIFNCTHNFRWRTQRDYGLWVREEENGVNHPESLLKPPSPSQLCGH